MAITNAQQYKQLVNKPANDKRPGYRGDAAYGKDSRSEQATSIGQAKGATGKGGSVSLGDGPKTGAPDQDRISDIRQANITLENLKQDKIEEKLEKFRNLGSNQRKFTSFVKKFSPIAMFAEKFGPLNTKDFYLEKYLDSKNAPMTKEQFANLTTEEQEKAFDNYMEGRLSGKTDAYGNLITNTDGDGVNQVLPVDTTFAQAPSDVNQEPKLTELQQMLKDTSRYRFAAEGGIMNNDVVGGEYDFESARQMYGLGKLVKKVTRTVKKIAKSPVGKLAIGAAILGTPFGAGSKGTGFFGSKSLFGRGLGFLSSKTSPFTKTVADFANDRLAFNAARTAAGSPSSIFSLIPGGKVGAGIFGASALAGLMTPKEEDEDEDQTAYRGESLDIADIRSRPRDFLAPRFLAEGGSTEKEPVAKKTMPLLDMGGKEKDYRETGGFVDMGRMEKADDVPARLSKNEFVFTADAVRNAGDGSVDKGAEVMYNMMKNLEAGGDVSEESQGLEGARKMFQTSQRLEEVL